jgi:hypothetical protein
MEIRLAIKYRRCAPYENEDIIYWFIRLSACTVVLYLNDNYGSAVGIGASYVSANMAAAVIATVCLGF